MNFFKGIVVNFLLNNKRIQDSPQLTNFLKNNSAFKQAAYKIHDTKENIKSKLWDQIEKEIEEEERKQVEETKRIDYKRNGKNDRV